MHITGTAQRLLPTSIWFVQYLVHIIWPLFWRRLPPPKRHSTKSTENGWHLMSAALGSCAI